MDIRNVSSVQTYDPNQLANSLARILNYFYIERPFKAACFTVDQSRHIDALTRLHWSQSCMATFALVDDTRPLF
jgi:hypothetical protein